MKNETFLLKNLLHNLNENIRKKRIYEKNLQQKEQFNNSSRNSTKIVESNETREYIENQNKTILNLQVILFLFYFTLYIHLFIHFFLKQILSYF